MHQTTISIETRGRGTYEITDRIAAAVGDSGIDAGLCHVFVQHTSASLIICENADPTVRQDLEHYFESLVKDGDPMYRHDAEGPDDMPAHIRSILTQTGLSVPITNGRLALGTWQGIYLWEHRYRGSARRLVVTVLG